MRDDHRHHIGLVTPERRALQQMLPEQEVHVLAVHLRHLFADQFVPGQGLVDAGNRFQQRVHATKKSHQQVIGRGERFFDQYIPAPEHHDVGKGAADIDRE